MSGPNPKKIPWKRIFYGIALVCAAVFVIFLGIVWRLIATAPEVNAAIVSPSQSATYILDREGTVLRKLSSVTSNRDIVSISEIPDDLEHAIVAIEDMRFYEHKGIDLKGILRALRNGLTTGSFSEGASTITQQLIKNSVFTEWTSETSFADRFKRKIQEQYLAVQLEKELSKEEILEDYLNTINLGAGCYGVQAASRRYFGKDVADLTLSESAVLAALPQNPTGFNPILFPEANNQRRTIILNYMEEQSYISASQKAEALEDPVYQRIRSFNQTFLEDSAYSYYEDALIWQVQQLLVSELGFTAAEARQAIYCGGLRIYSAQDASLQKICEEELSDPTNYPEEIQFGIDYMLQIADKDNRVSRFYSNDLRSYVRQNLDASFDLMCNSQEQAQAYAAKFQAAVLPEDGEIVEEHLTLIPEPQASLVLMEQDTGYVRAVAGGRGEKNASLTLNRAVETTRQPGSTFKILAAYAPALDVCGQTLATLYENEPYQYEDGTPVSNWDITDYTGAVSVREAILRSINVVAVKCITEITPQLGFQYAQNMGISTLHESAETSEGSTSDVIQPLALGGITEGVTNLDLCTAYASIANQGVYQTPRFFTRVEDRFGNVLLDSEKKHRSISSPRRVMQPSTAFLLTSAMTDVVKDPAGTAYQSIYAGSQPVAGKTGTTSSYKDIWFVGFTPYYTCSVWGGYDNNQPLPDTPLGHNYSKTLWSAVMNRIHQDLPVRQFTPPESVLTVTLCSDSHLPARKGICPDTYEEYFAQGTEPEEICPLHTNPPETEPIIIYPDLLDQLLPESEEEIETDVTPPEIPSEDIPPESSESETAGETETENNPLDDLLRRLIG